LACASTPDLVAAVRHGTIIDCDITTQDIARSEEIFGQSAAAIAGRATDHKARPLTFVNGMKETRPQKVHCDVFFIDGAEYIMAVAKPLDLMVVHEISDDRKFTSDDLSSAVNKVCDVLTSHGFTIDSIYFDGDGVKVKSQHKVDIAGAGDHVPIAERAIRTIEERVTALRMALPYTVSRSLGKHLVRYAATCLNLFPVRIYSTVATAHFRLKYLIIIMLNNLCFNTIFDTCTICIIWYIL
jgi:hypothetical protein